MPKLRLPDVSLHYEISGNGPPLLLIAGMMSDGASWGPVIPILEPHFTVIRPDMRTTGQTTPWNAPASIDVFAQDCAALLSHLGHDKAHVTGHSLGGLIAMRLATTQPQTIHSLTLAASAPLRLERNNAIFETLLAIRQSDAPKDTWLRALFPWLFAPQVYDIPGAIDDAVAASIGYPHSQTAEAMAHQLNALNGYVPDDLSTMHCPVQALLAADDLLMPLPLAQAALTNVSQHVIPAAGHSIHWDAPNAVANHVITFAEQHHAT